MAASLSLSPALAQVLEFADLKGWAEDDHREGLRNFITTCDQLKAPEWGPICALAPQAMANPDSARSFFELLFRPVLRGATPALFTGYYEPELQGSLVPTARFAYPLYRKPPELTEGQLYHPRSVIETGILRGRGLELAWLDDPVEVFFLQIQGSGRIRLPNGQVMRVGYAGKNQHPYRSIGQELIRRGSHSIAEVSAQSIKAWVRANPLEGKALLQTNPSFVFFRRIKDLQPNQGPIGAMGRPITPLRTVAIDPAFTPLGTPVWVEKAGQAPMQRLMVAQDTGGAIKGVQRADIFYGTGFKAGEMAGVVKDSGRIIQLLPIDLALNALAGD